jgi:hypothetical protein
MTPEEIHTWLEDNEPPWVFRTVGGRSYKISSRSNVWIPAAYPAMLCAAVTGRGVIMLRMSAIESIHIEHETAVWKAI